MNRIIVLGSSNTDFVLRLPRLPNPGETILAHDCQVTPGGKGANQAVAAARAGGQVAFVAAVGDDDFGRARRQELADNGIDVTLVRAVPGVPTGVAVILVGQAGENMIAVASGANHALTSAHASELPDAIFQPGDIFVSQLESPAKTVFAALARARRRGLRTIFNPAPVQAEVACREWLSLVDVLIVNEHELLGLTSNVRPPTENADLDSRIRRLHECGPPSIIVTLGSRGYKLSQEGRIEDSPAFEVHAVDTVAAGDAFVGALAARWSLGDPLPAAARWASAAAALAVTRPGAQASIPYRAQVEAFLLSR